MNTHSKTCRASAGKPCTCGVANQARIISAQQYQQITSERDRYQEALEKIAKTKGNDDRIICRAIIDITAMIAKKALKAPA